MNHEFRICDKCKKTNITSLTKKIKEIDKNASIVIGCQNVCGIGRTKSFVILDHILMIAENEEELLLKIKEQISK